MSYSRVDKVFALRLTTVLAALGADVWLDIQRIQPGDDWSAEIQDALYDAELMLLILSPDSMHSKNVMDEWVHFLAENKPIVPVLYRPARIHYRLNRLQRVDFHNQPFEQALHALHAALRGHGFDLQPPPQEGTIDGRDMTPEDGASPRGTAPLPPIDTAPGAVGSFDPPRRPDQDTLPMEPLTPEAAANPDPESLTMHSRRELSRDELRALLGPDAQLPHDYDIAAGARTPPLEESLDDYFDEALDVFPGPVGPGAPTNAPAPPTRPHDDFDLVDHRRPTRSSRRRGRGAEDAPHIIEGERLGRYHLLDELSTGELTSSYLARALSFNRMVVVKRLHPELAWESEKVRCFRRYYEINVALEHPHVLPVYDYGIIDLLETPFLTKRYMEGGSLRRVMGGRQFSPAAVARLLANIADALDYARDANVLHGDLTPEHILMDRSGRGFVSHLGYGQVFYREGAIRPDPAYIAPEVARGHALTAVSDVYALGVIVYELLAGQHPFAEVPRQLLDNAHLEAPPPPLRRFRADLPPLLEKVIATALAKSSERRYLSAGEFARAFARSSAAR